MKYLLTVLPVLAATGVVLSTDQSLWAILSMITSIIVSLAGLFLWEKFSDSQQSRKLAAALAALAIALAVGGLSTPLFASLPPFSPWILVSVLGGWGMYAGVNSVAKPERMLSPLPLQAVLPDTDKLPLPEGKTKVLDTSIVIDGRIIDIASTGFIEGPFVVPNFVLREIQLISDSSDPIKRNRGRRGLDMLNQLQKREDLEVKIDYKDYSETREVDAKLIRLAKDRNAVLVTNDFNLNKVAEFQGIKVLNLNNLANALKPVVLPGEELELQVVKEGKDENQGIGYLDDGTMVVIENGSKLLGKKVKVNVTSVIQTNSGKMFFTRIVTGKGN
ncbi:MAG: TRAM domain-containing protein [Leptospiraceae bacterium]|nr:TRAM domain-containing protein [Leptospiraceae bacterium]MCB1199286.1 TRAM domain-containing protein [Leptospiraceae bacterium]